MKMSEKTLLKKIEQAFKENYCNGSYKVEVDCTVDDDTSYVLFYTYKTGETIALDIDVTRLGEVKFYSPVHSYYISNFNNHIKSVINVLRMLFDLIVSNKEQMINYYEIETEETEKHYADFTSEDFIKDGNAKECARGNDVFDGCKRLHYMTDDCTKTVLNMVELFSQMFGNAIRSKCKMYNNSYYGCPADRQGNRCGGAQWCKQTWKRYAAIVNPEWHNVSLKTLANIDFDMLDERRQAYFSLYRKWKETIKNLRKCSCARSYERCYSNFRRLYITAFQNRKISSALVMYFDKKISMANVECGVWSSAVEVATGQKESRKFNRQTLRY